MPEISKGNPQNEPTPKHLRSRSKFPFSYRANDTFRFGEYHPHFVMEGVSNDNIKLRSSHTVRSFTLKAPLMEDITLKKDYFNVPMTALLPNNWKKFFAIPVQGSDYPVDCGPSSTSFYSSIATYMQTLFSGFKSVFASPDGVSVAVLMTSLCRYFTMLQMFYSPGSLLASLGIHLNAYFYATDTRLVPSGSPLSKKDADDVFEEFASLLSEYFLNIIVYNSSGNKTFYVGGVYDKALDVRDFFSYWNDNLDTYVTGVTLRDGKTWSEFLNNLNTRAFENHVFDYPVEEDGSNTPFNSSRIWAYQIVCAHFFTNDHVDYVFSAELFRSLVWQKFIALAGGTLGFTVNGLYYQYDALSGHVLDTVLTFLRSNIGTVALLGGSSSNHINIFSYLSLMFSFRRSLRYKDYFTGSHSQPLAVGDVGAAVDPTNNTVSAVDITKNILKQRLLNAANRVGARWEDYMKELTGKAVAPDYTQPFWLASTGDVIYGSEVENTGAAQMISPSSVTSTLRSNGSRYEFTFEPDRDCVIIGIVHFDIPRSYFRTIERTTMALSRYDYFNEYMQFTGDQPVFSAELGSIVSHTEQSRSPYFAYQLKDMQYKQRYNVANGGFVSYLEGWSFLADYKYTGADHISPDYIRSRSTELDRFFTSLTGKSLGRYFHFIIRNTNDCEANRPMAYAPTIL